MLDLSRHMDAIGEVDAAARRVRVEPGVVQERLNRAVQPLRARLRAGHLDVEPGDARRHDRQQLLGQRVDRLRHDDRSRPRAGGRARRRLARHVLGGLGAAQRLRAADPRRRRGDPARPRAGDRRGLPEALAPVGRLPARPPRPVRPLQADRRLRGHAGDRHRRDRRGWSSCRRRRCSPSGTSTRCWARSRPPHDALGLGPSRGRDDRPHDPRALAREARVPRARRPARRRPGGAAVRLVLR